MSDINKLPQFSIDRDMKGIYRGLYSKLPEGFPEVLVFQDLQTAIMKRMFPDGRKILYVKDDTDEELINCVCDELKNPRCPCEGLIPITYHSLSDKEVAKRLVYACYVADSLTIPLKQICFTHGEESDGYSEEFITFIGDNSIWDALGAIAHELRHAWQHKYKPNMIDDYIHPVEDEDLYLNQLSEIDAEAFSIKFESMVTGIDLINYEFGNLFDPQYRAKIVRRMQEVDVVLSSKKKKEIQRIVELEKMLNSIGRG